MPWYLWGIASGGLAIQTATLSPSGRDGHMASVLPSGEMAAACRLGRTMKGSPPPTGIRQIPVTALMVQRKYTDFESGVQKGGVPPLIVLPAPVNCTGVGASTPWTKRCRSPSAVVARNV